MLLSLPKILADPTLPTGRGQASVVINELMAAQQQELADEHGDFPDWIELMNGSAGPVSLLGWSLSDDPNDPNKWMLPEVELLPGETLVIFASGKGRQASSGEAGVGTDDEATLHAGFKLAADGGYLALYDNTSRRFLDASAVEYPAQIEGLSYGRCLEGEGYCYLGPPTPGRSNDSSESWRGYVSPVKFSVLRGFYDSPITVELTTETPEATIRYTTDGSEPTESNGTVYSEPLTIDSTTPLRAAAFKPDFLRSPSTTHTYIFLDDIVDQPAEPAGFPATWGTHRIDFAGQRAGTPVVADYEMDPEVIQDPRYGDRIRDSLLSLPTISLVTDSSNLDIYFQDPQMRGVESERPISVEMIFPDGSQEAFQVNAGVRIQGGAGRWEFMPKHSFRLFFKDDYGPTKLQYPLFPGSPVEEFDTVVLRAGADRSFAGHPDTEDHRQTTYTRDEWLRRSEIAVSGFGAHGRFVHLYINGLYWGLYNLVERPDASFAASYFGKDKDDWYVANQGGSVSGQIDRFHVMRQLVEEGNLADPQRYATMTEFIDPVQFSDYMVLNWFAGNQDWPENNWYVAVQYPAGHNLFFTWDGEGTWQDGAAVRLGVDDVGDTYFPNIIKPLFLALWENPDFRMTLADRLYRHTATGGALTDSEAKRRWMAVNSEIEQAVIAESARWGDVRYDRPITQEDWYRAAEQVLEQMSGNAERLIEEAREAGYYPPIDPPHVSLAPGQFESMVAASLQTPVGEIYYTTDGSDPRLPISGEVSPSAQRYREPLALDTTTRVKARVLADGVWSALYEADFVEVGEPAGLRITELMYHPLGGDAYEFLELSNVSGLDIDLASAYFEGIDLRFDRQARIPAGGRLVVSPDFAAYRERYPEAPIHAIYAGVLSDSGETIVLRDAWGHVLASVSYDDENGWPLSPDGLGDSLVFQHWQEDPDNPLNWRASSFIHGTPGTGEPSIIR